MTGPELATLSTLAWVVLTLAILVVFGSWSTNESSSLLPGLVRGVRDWATEQVAARSPCSPSPWAVTMPAAASPAAASTAEIPDALAPSDETAEIEDLWTRPT